MQNQPKFYPQRSTRFFADGRSARPQVVNSVARGQLHQDAFFYTGLDSGGQEKDALPFPATADLLARGQERFNIYCTPCHSRVGNGAGMIVDRGYKPAGNFHDAKRLAEPLSHYFVVMTNGYGAMPDYNSQLSPADRWAVAAYIRALQLSQNADASAVPAGTEVQRLEDVATSMGYPESFASAWKLPDVTNVNSMPPGPGAPGNAPAEAAPGVLMNMPNARHHDEIPSGQPTDDCAHGRETHLPAGEVRTPDGTRKRTTPKNTACQPQCSPTG